MVFNAWIYYLVYCSSSFVPDTNEQLDVNHESCQYPSPTSISDDPTSYSTFVTFLGRHHGSLKNIETVFNECCCSSTSSFTRDGPPLKLLALENGDSEDEDDEDQFDGDLQAYQPHSGVVVVFASIRAQWEFLEGVFQRVWRVSTLVIRFL
jgi:hypothetical protein